MNDTICIVVKPTRRLIKARSELRSLISMVENDAPSLQLVSQSRKVQSSLAKFNREILSYHLFVCVRKQTKSEILLNELENIAKVLSIKNKFRGARQFSVDGNMKED